MVAGTDSHTQQVAQVPKHGHEGKLPIVCRRWGIVWEKQMRGEREAETRARHSDPTWKAQDGGNEGLQTNYSTQNVLNVWKDSGLA